MVKLSADREGPVSVGKNDDTESTGVSACLSVLNVKMQSMLIFIWFLLTKYSMKYNTIYCISFFHSTKKTTVWQILVFWFSIKTLKYKTAGRKGIFWWRNTQSESASSSEVSSYSVNLQKIIQDLKQREQISSWTGRKYVEIIAVITVVSEH